MRSDDIGFFWQDVYDKKGSNWNRPLAAIPETGWYPPESFPDLSGAKQISVDVESFDPDIDELGPGTRRGAYIVGVAVGVPTGERWYYPIRHKLGGNLPPEQVIRWASDNLSRENQPKLGANLSYDMDMLAQEGVHVAGPHYDVQIAEPLLDENRLTYALDVLGTDYGCGGKTDEILYNWCAQSYGGAATRKQAGNIWRAPPQLVGPYAEGDVDLPFKIFEKQKVKLEEQGLWDLFQMESDLLPMMLAMRRRGVRVNVPAAEKFLGVATEEINRLTKELGGINVNGSDDLVRLCKKEGIVFPTTDLGNPSFRKDWLANNVHPAMRKVTEVRSLMKLRDTFVQGYIIDYNILGRIHCLFNQLRSDIYGTVSGRFSSSNPNLQNIPTRTELGKQIRAMFMPEEGEDWECFDWSQIEFRLLVHYAMGRGAETAREMYRNNPDTDFHQMTCDMINKIVHIDRDPAKNINFGLVYGMGEPLLASILGKSLAEVQELFQGYHAAVPFVKHTYNKASQRARQREFIKTILGRRRRFPGGEFTHKALNGLLQGGAADIMKKAMVLIWKSGICDVLGAPLLTVHDELDFSVPRTKEAHQALREAHHIMETCVPLKVPLLCTRKSGPDWGHLKKVAA